MMDTAPVLSDRQLEFLVLSSSGLTCAQIAQRCYASPRTVQEYLDDARGRLDARNIPQAVVKAISLGILVVNPDGTAKAR